MAQKHGPVEAAGTAVPKRRWNARVLADVAPDVHENLGFLAKTMHRNLSDLGPVDLGTAIPKALARGAASAGGIAGAITATPYLLLPEVGTAMLARSVMRPDGAVKRLLTTGWEMPGLGLVPPALGLGTTLMGRQTGMMLPSHPPTLGLPEQPAEDEWPYNTPRY
jgi:hypothetical protein